MSDEERAQLFYEAAKQAARRGDCDIFAGLLQEAIDTHPRHFSAAVDALRDKNQLCTAAGL